MSGIIAKGNVKRTLAIIWCVVLVLNLSMLSPTKILAVDPNIALNKPVTLVDSSGNAVDLLDIATQGTNLVDGNNSTVAQTQNTLFGAKIHLGGLIDVSSVEVTNHWANYITNYDIKGSVDGVTWVTLASGITITASETKLTTLSSVFNGRFIWIAPNSYSSSSWFCIAEIKVNGVSQPNYILSTSRTVTLVDSSGSAVPSGDIAYPGSNLVDGNKNNYAQTVNTLFGAKIDLGGTADITKIEVTNYWANYITSFDIKGSVDGTTWDTLASGITMSASESKVTTLSATYKGRYIWIAPTAYSSTTWRCFSEVSVYGQRTPPVYGFDNNGFRTFEADGKRYVAFGIDLDSFAARDGDVTYLTQQMDANVYINANFVAIPVCWKTIEPTMNNYDFSLIDNYINLAKDRGLKVSLMWHGTNYASGNNSFIPDYIINYSTVYTRNYGSSFANNSILCPSNKDTLNREKAAYNNLLSHVKDFDVAKTVMCVSTTSEIDYMGGLDPQYYLPPEQNVRCECGLCTPIYNAELAADPTMTNVQFMEKQFSRYAKELYDFGALTYDLPSYSAVCANSYFAGWRYAENPNVLKSTVNSSNHIVVPSIANPDTIAIYKSDMDLFMSSAIPNNFIFTDGIDMGAHINGNVECAPWINMLWYGGLGAIYWDTGEGYSTSIVTNTTLKEKLRKYFAPLKGIQFYLSWLKTSSNKFWWQYGQTTSTASTANFTFKQTNNVGQDYGVAFEINPNELIFSGSTKGGSYTMEVTRTGGFSGYTFEKGYFNATTGAWVKYATVSPTLSGSKATITVGTGDAGLYDRAVYRYFKNTEANLSSNKPISLVNSSGALVPTSDIAFAASKLIDSSSSTYAQTVNTLFGAKIDLMGSSEVYSVSVTNYSANYVTNYNIKGSADGINWTTLASNISIGASQTITTTLSPKYTGRYIWIAPNSYSTSTWRCISEIAVTGRRY